MKFYLALLAILLSSMSGCSFVYNYWVMAEYDLTRCPSEQFEFPERVAVGKGLSAASDFVTYCHGFSFFNVYPILDGVSYFDVTVDHAHSTIALYARLERGATCKLQVVVSERCGFNTPKDECRKKTFSNVSEDTIKDAIRLATDELLYHSGSKSSKMTDLHVIGFDDEFKKWCETRATEALQVGQR